MSRPRARRLFRLPIRRRDLLQEDLNEEVQLHLEMRAEQLVDQGMSKEQARIEARRHFGSEADMRRGAVRRERALGLREVLADLSWDAKLSLRGLRKTPSFTATAIMTLALGIGANAAIFSVVNPILIEALPYPDSRQLVMLWEKEPSGTTSNLGFATIADIAAENRSFEAVAALRSWTPTITGDGLPERLAGQRVSPRFFSVLGVAPALGRSFQAQDDLRGEEEIVILSHGLWQRRFGGEADLVGRAITLNGSPATVVGVMPAGFESLLDPAAQLWAPLRYTSSLPWACRTCRHLRVVARLLPEVSEAQAQREMSMLSERLFRRYPTEYAAPGMLVSPLREEIISGIRPALVAALVAVALLLLITCANVSNLILARARQRRGDLAVRAALGATRWRVIRSLLTESVVLAAFGGAAGLALAVAGVHVLVRISPQGLPRLDQVAVDSSVLTFAIVTTALVGLAFGVVAGLQLTRGSLGRSLRQEGQRVLGGSRATRATLVVAQVALTLILLVGAGLLLRSQARLMEVEPGFDPRGLLSMQIQVSGPAYESDNEARGFFDRVLKGVRELSGVKSAAFTSQLPLSGDFDMYGVHFESRPRANPEQAPNAHRYAVSPGYLETMSLPLQHGIDLDEHAIAGKPPVVLISESLARRELGGLEPVGERIRIGGADEGPWRTIIGIVGDAKQTSLATASADAIYLPEAQGPWADRILSLVLRTEGDPALLVNPVREVVRAIDPDQPIIRVATMEQLLADSTARTRFALSLFQAFGAVALLLAAVGLYGVLSGGVIERRSEIGVRTALGATRMDILRMVIRQGLFLTLIGVVLGTIASISFGKVIESLLFEISRGDFLTFGAVSALLMAVALLAAWIPAQRAARVDPVEALRKE